MKGFLFFLFALASLFSADFDSMMGKEEANWSFLRTKEDRDRLSFYRSAYEKNCAFLSQQAARIPQKMHVVWLGPAPLPKRSLSNLAKWAQLHPDWELYLWTDVDRPAPPLKGMQIRRVADYSFHLLGYCYDRADNFKEKAAILGLEVLFQEGGLLVDHDVEPLHSFSPLHASYDFYCGLAPLAPSILSSSVFISTHLLAAKPRHPVLIFAMAYLREMWEEMEVSYSGNSTEAVVYRAAQRLSSAMDSAMEKGFGQRGNRDIVFPSEIFSLSERKTFSYATHQRVGSWKKRESPEELKVREKMEAVMKKSSSSLFLATVPLLVLLGGTLCYLLIRRREG